MARTNVPTTTLTPNNGTAAPAGTAIDVTNGMNVQFPAISIPAAPTLADCILVVSNTVASAKTVIIRAGQGGGINAGPAFRAGIGDLTVNLPASSTVYVGPLESARFSQNDGSLNVDFGAATAGTVTAIVRPIRW